MSGLSVSPGEKVPMTPRSPAWSAILKIRRKAQLTCSKSAQVIEVRNVFFPPPHISERCCLGWWKLGVSLKSIKESRRSMWARRAFVVFETKWKQEWKTSILLLLEVVTSIEKTHHFSATQETALHDVIPSTSLLSTRIGSGSARFKAESRSQPFSGDANQGLSLWTSSIELWPSPLLLPISLPHSHK